MNPLQEFFTEDELWRVAIVTICLLVALGVFIYTIAQEDARCKQSKHDSNYSNRKEGRTDNYQGI